MTVHLALAAYLRDVRNVVAKHGWMVQGVAPRVGDTGVSFAYTVGLTAAGHPELIIVGLPVEIAYDLLENAAQRATDTTINAGDTLDGIATAPLRVAAVDDLGPVSVARQLYPGRVKLLQLLWPDKDGAYPGDPTWSLGTWQDIAVISR